MPDGGWRVVAQAAEEGLTEELRRRMSGAPVKVALTGARQSGAALLTPTERFNVCIDRKSMRRLAALKGWETRRKRKPVEDPFGRAGSAIEPSDRHAYIVEAV
jgi:hypothetical protein